MRVDEYVLTQSTDPEEQGAEAVVGESEKPAKSDAQVPSSSKEHELEDEDLDVHEASEEGGHEGESEPVAESERNKEKNTKPV